MFYQFHDFFIPLYMGESIKNYINYGIPPGGFLSAVICNDLRGAVGKADDINIKNLPAYVAYFYNEAPGNCWGSSEIMDSWIKAFKA